MGSSVENQTMKTENRHKMRIACLPTTTIIVGHMIVDSEAHACRPAVPSLYQTMTKKLSGLYKVKVYQSINFLSMFAILQNDVIKF